MPPSRASGRGGDPRLSGLNGDELSSSRVSQHRAQHCLRTYAPREIDILYLVAEGLPNKLIAARLGVAERTVATHLERLYRRLGVHTRVQAVIVWMADTERTA